VRSYFVGDGFVWKPTDAPPYYRAYAGRGVVRLGSGRYHFDRPQHFDYARDPTPTRRAGYHPGTLADRLNFDFHRGSDSHGTPPATPSFRCGLWLWLPPSCPSFGSAAFAAAARSAAVRMRGGAAAAATTSARRRRARTGTAVTPSLSVTPTPTRR
jgi:hypothetical protein